MCIKRVEGTIDQKALDMGAGDDHCDACGIGFMLGHEVVLFVIDNHDDRPQQFIPMHALCVAAVEADLDPRAGQAV